MFASDLQGTIDLFQLAVFRSASKFWSGEADQIVCDFVPCPRRVITDRIRIVFVHELQCSTNCSSDLLWPVRACFPVRGVHSSADWIDLSYCACSPAGIKKRRIHDCIRACFVWQSRCSIGSYLFSVWIAGGKKKKNRIGRTCVARWRDRFCFSWPDRGGHIVVLILRKRRKSAIGSDCQLVTYKAAWLFPLRSEGLWFRFRSIGYVWYWVSSRKEK